MNIGRLFTSLALLNPFAVKVVAHGDSLFAYRNLLGIKVLVGGKAETRAFIDYVSGKSLKQERVTKAMIGAPFAFVDPRQGQLLEALMTPAKAEPTLKDLLPARMTPKTKPLSAKMAGKQALRFPTLAETVAKRGGGPDVKKNGIFQNPPSVEKVLRYKGRGLPPGYTPTQCSWMAWNFAQLDLTVEVKDAHLVNAAWPLK